MERIIEIKGLAVMAYIGVPEEERAVPQKLSCDLRFAASFQPKTLEDHLSATIDYAAVSNQFEKIVQARPRCLLETVAEEAAEALQNQFQLRWIELTLRKFILPNTEYVAVTIRR